MQAARSERSMLLWRPESGLGLTLWVLLACRTQKRLILLDYDGTLNAQNLNPKPTEPVMNMLRALTDDPSNTVFIISGRARREIGDWFASLVRCTT